MGSINELQFGETHPTIIRGQTYLASLTDKDWIKVEKKLRSGMAENNRECILLWGAYKKLTTENPILPEEIMFLILYIRDLLT